MIVQISSGMGPRECEIAVARLAEALRREHPGTEIVETRGTGGCLTSAVLSGPDALAEAAGTVQWICRSPLRPHHGRKNWFIHVSVVPEIAKVRLDGEIRFERLHAGGPGGQNVNKVETGVRLTHLPTGIVVACTEERSQHRNRSIALSRLQVRLHELEEGAAAGQRKAAWREHSRLVRGNAVRVYEGPDFVRRA